MLKGYPQVASLEVNVAPVVNSLEAFELPTNWLLRITFVLSEMQRQNVSNTPSSANAMISLRELY